MKKIFSIFAMVVAVLTVIIACVSHHGEGWQERMSNAEQVGIRHNQGLDSLFNELMQERVEMFNSSRGLRDRWGATDRGFPGTYDFDPLVQGATRRLVKNWYPVADDAFLDAVMSGQNTRSSSIDGVALLTPFQQEYYNYLLELLNKDQSVEAFVGDVVALEKEIMKNAPTGEEAEILLMGTSVARNSARYWAENMKKWACMLNGEIVSVDPADDAPTRQAGRVLADGLYAHPTDPSLFYSVSNGVPILMKCPDGLWWNDELCVCDRPQNVNWQKIADKDIEGTIGGAAGGAAAGAMAGGIGAIPGAAAGAVSGGIAGSVIAGIGELRNWIRGL